MSIKEKDRLVKEFLGKVAKVSGIRPEVKKSKPCPVNCLFYATDMRKKPCSGCFLWKKAIYTS